jgi:hypothetical protein
VVADVGVEGRFIADHRRKMAPPAPEESATPSPRPRRAPQQVTPEPVEVA